MNNGNKVVTGVFTYLDDTLLAIRQAKAEGRRYKVYSPIPIHAISEETSPTRSPICKVTATGALTGITLGFSLCILTNLDWPIRVSAKDIVSIPAFVPVGYECTILLGAIFTLLALLHYCKIPDIFRAPGYDPRFSQDKFGVVIGCNGFEIEEIKQKLMKCGAEEVREGEGL